MNYGELAARREASSCKSLGWVTRADTECTMQGTGLGAADLRELSDMLWYLVLPGGEDPPRRQRAD